MLMNFVGPLCLGALVALFSDHEDTKTQRYHEVS